MIHLTTYVSDEMNTTSIDIGSWLAINTVLMMPRKWLANWYEIGAGDSFVGLVLNTINAGSFAYCMKLRMREGKTWSPDFLYLGNDTCRTVPVFWQTSFSHAIVQSEGKFSCGKYAVNEVTNPKSGSQ